MGVAEKITSAQRAPGADNVRCWTKNPGPEVGGDAIAARRQFPLVGYKTLHPFIGLACPNPAGVLPAAALQS